MSLMQRILIKGTKLKGAADKSGQDFEIKLLMLFLLRALTNKILVFFVLSNVKEYGCFDDLVIHYKYKDQDGIEHERIALVQAKHAKNPKIDQFTLKDLENNKTKKLNLNKYFNGYKDCRKTLSANSDVPVDYIIYTNRRFSDDMLSLLSSNPVIENNMSYKLLNSNVAKKETKLDIAKLKKNVKFSSWFQENEKNEKSDGEKFIENLSYYMEQSSESGLHEIIKNEYKAEYTDDSDEIFDFVFQEVTKRIEGWTKETTSTFLTKDDRIFETARENAIINDMRSRSKQKLDRTPYQDLNFYETDLNTLVTQMSGSVAIVFTTKKAATLTTLKVFQAFKKDKNQPIITDPQELEKCYEFRIISSAQERQVIIVNCFGHNEDLNSQLQNLPQVWRDNLNIKIILISKYDQSKAQNDVVQIKDCYNLSQFTLKTIIKILEKTLELQGREVKLSSLMNKKSKLEMTPDVMQDLLEERINIGPPIENLKTVANYYLARTFYRNDKIKLSVFTDASIKDAFVTYALSEDDLSRARMEIDSNDSNDSNREMIVSSDGNKAQETYEEFCKHNTHVHILKIVVTNDNVELKWQKSSKSIENIAKYFNDSQPTPTDIFSEDEFLKASKNDKITIITDLAGMGKTCVFKSLANNKNISEGDLVLQIDVKKLASEKEITNLPSRKEDALQFLLSQVMQVKKDIDLTLQFVQDTNIRIFLDGLDEISSIDSKKILELLQHLRSISNIKMYISSRPNLQRELETTLNTISYKMQGFTPTDQLEFLNKYYDSILKDNPIFKKSKVQEFSNIVLEILRHKLEDSVREIAGIPLITRMIADIYLGKLKKYLAGSHSLSFKKVHNIGLYKMYNDFIRCTCKRYYTEKLKHQGDREDQNLQGNIEDVINKHKILAVYFFCKEENIDVEEFLADCEKSQLATLLKNRSENEIGIVSEIKDDGDVTFLHRSLAEYLLTIHILQNIENRIECISNLKIFTDSKWNLVQKFVDSYLSEDFDKKLAKLYTAMVNLSFPEDGTSPLITALRAGNSNICNLIIESINMYYNQGESASTDEKSRVLNTLIQMQDKDGLNALCHAIINNSKNKPGTVLLLLSHITAIKNINKHVHKGMPILHLAIEHECTAQDVQKIISYEDADINLQDGYGNTALHVAARHGSSDLTKFLLDFKVDGNQTDHGSGDQPPDDDSTSTTKSKRGVDINIQNKYGLTALHEAAHGGHFDVASLLLGRGADVKIQNNDGDTALHEAAHRGHCDVAKLLLLDIGAYVNVQNSYGLTVLHFAAIGNLCDLTTLLLNGGADTNIQNKVGATALHWAARGGHCDVASLLLGHGAYTNVKNDDGHTAFDVAEREKNSSMVKLLQERAASIAGPSTSKRRRTRQD